MDTLQQCLSLGLSTFFSHFFFTFSPLQMAISCHINFCQNRKRGYRDLVYAQYAWQSRRRRRRRYASWVPGSTIYTCNRTVSPYHRARYNTILSHIYLLVLVRLAWSFRHYCPIHLVSDYIQKRRGEPGLFSFEYNLLPKLISK